MTTIAHFVFVNREFDEFACVSDRKIFQGQVS